MYRVELSHEATKFFEQGRVSFQRKLDRCFDNLKVDPRHHNNIKPLRGKLKGHYRYRVGEYRAIYRIDERKREVFVLKIAHRSAAYE